MHYGGCGPRGGRSYGGYGGEGGGSGYSGGSGGYSGGYSGGGYVRREHRSGGGGGGYGRGGGRATPRRPRPDLTWGHGGGGQREGYSAAPRFEPPQPAPARCRRHSCGGRSGGTPSSGGSSWGSSYSSGSSTSSGYASSLSGGTFTNNLTNGSFGIVSSSSGGSLNSSGGGAGEEATTSSESELPSSSELGDSPPDGSSGGDPGEVNQVIPRIIKPRKRRKKEKKPKIPRMTAAAEEQRQDHHHDRPHQERHHQERHHQDQRGDKFQDRQYDKRHDRYQERHYDRRREPYQEQRLDVVRSGRPSSLGGSSTSGESTLSAYGSEWRLSPREQQLSREQLDMLCQELSGALRLRRQLTPPGDVRPVLGDVRPVLGDVRALPGDVRQLAAMRGGLRAELRGDVRAAVRNDLRSGLRSDPRSGLRSDLRLTPPASPTRVQAGGCLRRSRSDPNQRCVVDDRDCLSCPSSLEFRESSVNIPQPPQRPWLPLGRPSSTQSTCIFTVMCYNVLCEKYATRQMYAYCPNWALEWEYRKKNIMQEILNYSADIITLQEVQTDQFYNFFLPTLQREKYEGIFQAKSRAKTMAESERKFVDGCAIFWRTEKFSLVKEYLIEFNQLAMANAEGSDDMLNRVMTKDNIGLAAMLETREAAWESGAAPPEPGHQHQRLMVCTAHIHWDPEFCDVKLIQTMMLMHEIRQIMEQAGREVASFRPGARGNTNNIQLLLCGDLNSLPDSGVVEFLVNGRVPATHNDFKELGYRTCLKKLSSSSERQSTDYHHPFRLASSYSPDIMPYTNYTYDFKGIIDYIFYNRETMTPLGILGPLDSDWLRENKVQGCPHPHVPSDHFSLLVELEMTQARADPANGLIGHR